VSAPLTLSAADFQKQSAANMSEAQLQTTVLAAAAAQGWLAYHTHDSRRSQPGFPDLVLVAGTRVLFRELKTQKGRIRPEQQTWIDRLAAAGADVAVWRPLDWFTGTIPADLAVAVSR
jgi:hypothetical protein